MRPPAEDAGPGGLLGVSPRAAPDDVLLREQLSSLRGLLAMSLLMMERRHESDVLHLAASAVPGLARCRALGVHLVGTGWDAATTTLPDDARAPLAEQLEHCPRVGGPVVVGRRWAWAYPLRSVEALLGHLVVEGVREPGPSEQVLLRSLAQQAGIAVANVRLHASTQAANAALARTVRTLEHKTAIHDRFTQVAVEGGGHDGIVTALHELTGLPAGLEDRAGFLLAWAGPGPWRPRRPADPVARERLVARALRSGRPVRVDGRLATVVRPRPDVLGVLFLVDPGERAAEADVVALEHGATVLAIELARLASVAETELRLGVDIVSELLAGTDPAGAVRRAHALGHDLSHEHRVVVVRGRTGDDGVDDALLRVVREAGDTGAGRPLVMQRADTVVLVVADPLARREPASRRPARQPPWEALAAVLAGTGAGRGCRIGVGGRCEAPEDYPRSYKEARLALRLAETGGFPSPVTLYDDLGVYQLLSDVADPAGVDVFVRSRLGTLLDYDARRGADLVTTLSRFLDAGGNYDATAAALGVGRSTVRYRLSRIRELSGHDLSDPDTRFQLQLAARAWFTFEAVREVRRPPG